MNPPGLRWFWIWIGIMPTCPNPEALQRLALSSHCRNLLKCPAFKTGTSRKICATKQRVKHTYAAYALSLLSKKTKQLNMEHQRHTISSFLNKLMFQERRSVSSILSQDGYKDIRLLLYFICIPLEWLLLLKRLVPPKRTLPARVVQSNKTEFTLWCCWYGEYLSVRRVSCISTWCRIVSINHVNSIKYML